MTAPAGDLLLAARGLLVGHRRPLLQPFDLEVRPGQCWFVLGRNGAGKTTLVHTLLRLLPALGGELVTAADIADRRGLGFVPQELRFQASLPMTVAEFVGLGQAGLRLPRSQRRAQVAAALATLQIETLATEPLARLSVGQQRRALVARALARRPRLLVLDEPGANLDQPTAAKLAADLERLRRQEGLAQLHISHDQQLAAAAATHVLLVHDGAVAAGTRTELLAGAAVQAAVGLTGAEVG